MTGRDLGPRAAAVALGVQDALVDGALGAHQIRGQSEMHRFGGQGKSGTPVHFFDFGRRTVAERLMKTALIVVHVDVIGNGSQG